MSALKYLFTAEYRNGATYEQTPQDVSVKEPEKRSAFYDIDHEQLVKFTLEGAGHTYSVDLRDGHFEVDGNPFYMHEEPLEGFELIFFRQHTHTFRAVDKRELSHEIVYRMGWKLKGNQNYQRVMQIK